MLVAHRDTAAACLGRTTLSASDQHLHDGHEQEHGRPIDNGLLANILREAGEGAHAN